MPSRPTQRRSTAGPPQRRATRNYSALCASLLEGMAHGWMVELTVADDGARQRTVKGRITKWDEVDELVLAIAKLPAKERRGHTPLRFLVGGSWVRLNSIVKARWVDRA